MADDFYDHINPVTSRQPVERVDNRPREAPAGRREARSISGRVTAVRHGRPNQGRGHVLDLTVGADDFTEIVLRVPPGIYNNLEGRRVVMYVDE